MTQDFLRLAKSDFCRNTVCFARNLTKLGTKKTSQAAFWKFPRRSIIKLAKFFEGAEFIGCRQTPDRGHDASGVPMPLAPTWCRVCHSCNKDQ